MGHHTPCTPHVPLTLPLTDYFFFTLSIQFFRRTSGIKNPAKEVNKKLIFNGVRASCTVQ